MTSAVLHSTEYSQGLGKKKFFLKKHEIMLKCRSELQLFKLFLHFCRTHLFLSFSIMNCGPCTLQLEQGYNVDGM